MITDFKTFEEIVNAAKENNITKDIEDKINNLSNDQFKLFCYWLKNSLDKGNITNNELKNIVKNISSIDLNMQWEMKNPSGQFYAFFKEENDDYLRMKKYVDSKFQKLDESNKSNESNESNKSNKSNESNESNESNIGNHLFSYFAGNETLEDIIFELNSEDKIDITLIVDTIVKIMTKSIEDKNDMNGIVERASNLLQSLSAGEDAKDLYATLENRITSEIKELYRIYESGEDKSDEISNKQALINTLDSISKRNKEEPHDIESPYLTTDEFKDISSKKESGFLKQYLLELHLAEVAYGDNWKEKIKIPDFTKNIEKWNRGMDNDKKITILDEEKEELESKCLENIKKFLDGEDVDLSNLSFDAGLRLFSDSLEKDGLEEEINNQLFALKDFHDKSQNTQDNDFQIEYSEKYKKQKEHLLKVIDEFYQKRIDLINSYIEKCISSKEKSIDDEDRKRYDKIRDILLIKLNDLTKAKEDINNRIINDDFDEKEETTKEDGPEVDEAERKKIIKKKVLAGIAGFTGGVLTAVFAPAPVVAFTGTILLVNRIIKLAGVVGVGFNKYAETHQDGKIAKLVAGYNSFIELPRISKIVKAYNNPYFQWALSGFTTGIFVGGFYKNIFASQSSASDAKQVASSASNKSVSTGSADSVSNHGLQEPQPSPSDTQSTIVSPQPQKTDLTHFNASNMHSAYYTSYDANPVSIQSNLFADTKVINTNVVNGELKVALGAQDGTPLGWFNAEDIGVTQDMINEAVSSGGLKL